METKWISTLRNNRRNHKLNDQYKNDHIKNKYIKIKEYMLYIEKTRTKRKNILALHIAQVWLTRVNIFIVEKNNLIRYKNRAEDINS